MVNCVSVMHGIGVAIQDIKCENFLAHSDEPESVRVAAFDFGLATRVESRPVTYVKGAQGWYSPEKWKHFFKVLTDHDPLKADIYALGVCLYSVLDQQPLEVERYYLKAPDPHRNLLLKIEDYGVDKLAVLQFLREYEADWNDYVPKNCFEKLVKAMTNPDPIFRPDIELVSTLLSEALSGDPSVEAKLDKLLEPPTIFDFLKKVSSGELDHERAKGILEGSPKGSWIVRFSKSINAHVVAQKTGARRNNVRQVVIHPGMSRNVFYNIFRVDKQFIG